MSTKQVRKLKRLINDVNYWAVKDSWKGSKEPETIDIIEKEFKKAKKKLNEFIASLTKVSP
jgi:hypothetical protein